MAPTIGIPHQNLVVGDREGHIAWAIAGRIPDRTGPDRSNGRSGWLGADLQPRIVDPEVGRVWTANARATDEAQQEIAIGADDASVGADYDLGARAQQIRDDLLSIPRAAAPADMLRIQLDDRAVFLSRWRALLLQLLDTQSVTGKPRRAQFRQLLSEWSGHASVDSVGYRLVREIGMTWSSRNGKVFCMPGHHAGEDTTVPAQFDAARGGWSPSGHCTCSPPSTATGRNSC